MIPVLILIALFPLCACGYALLDHAEARAEARQFRCPRCRGPVTYWRRFRGVRYWGCNACDASIKP